MSIIHSIKELYAASTKCLFACMFLMFSLFACSLAMVVYAEEEATDKLHFSAEEWAWLDKHPEVSIGFITDMPPALIVGESGEYTGLLADYAKLLSQQTGINFRIQPSASWSDMLASADKRETDIIGAVSLHIEYLSRYHFTLPISYTKYYIYGTAQAPKPVADIKELSDKRIGYITSFRHIESFVRKYQDIDFLPYPKAEGLINAFSRGEIDFIIHNVAFEYLRQRKGITRYRILRDIPELEANEFMAVRNDWPELAVIINKVLAANQDQTRAILNRWLEFANSIKVADNEVQLTEEEQVWIAKHPNVRVSFDPSLAPSEIFDDSGKPQDISVQHKHNVNYAVLWQVLGGAALIVLIVGCWNRCLVTKIAQGRKIETALTLSKQVAERARQQAQHTAKVKSDFLINMSHEIRTLMNAAIGIGYLLRQTELTKQQREYLDKMAYTSEALLDIIDNILDLSKGEVVKLELHNITFNLEQLLHKIKQTFEVQATQKGLLLAVCIAPNVPDTLIGDQKKLSQILRNLIANAIKFTGKGEVEIDVDVDLLEPTASKAQLRFTVKDTGSGISPEVQKKLFQPFSQGDSSVARQYGGTGLGLAISQQFAELMGSGITIISRPGEGSSFSFIATFDICELPTRFKSVPPRKFELITPHPGLADTRVLLVEDDEVSQFFEKKILLAFGAQVEIAASGLKALEMLKSKTFDIVLMDIQMPEMDGYEITRVIRREKKWQTLPIIALTAHVLSDERDKRLAAGMNDYLSKPFEPIQLQDMILKWCASGQISRGAAIRSH